MPHWDEGTLQAWLDGSRSGLSAEEREAIAAHVASCDTCAARVAVLEASTDRAAALLASAGQGEVPPFAAVLERAGQPVAREEGVGAKPLRRRWSATRWAASIVLAVGAGWLANDMYRRGAVPSGPTAESAAVGALDARQSADQPDIEIPAPPLEDAVAQEVAGRSAATDEERPVAAPQAAVAPLADAAANVTRPAAEPGGLPPTPIDARTRQVAEASGPPPAAPEAERTREESTPETLRGRVVDAASGRPLEAVQVFLPQLRTGALSLPDGSFTLDLRGQPLDSIARELTVEAQLIGYGSETRRLDLAGGDTAALEFALQSTALEMDELLVTGAAEPRADAAEAPARAGARSVPDAARAEATRPGSGIAPITVDFAASARWSAIGQGDFGADDAATLQTLPGLDVVAVRRATVSDVGVTRVEQRLEDGTPVTLFVAGRPLAIENRGGANVAQREVGDRWVAAVAALDESALRARLETIR